MLEDFTIIGNCNKLNYNSRQRKCLTLPLTVNRYTYSNKPSLFFLFKGNRFLVFCTYNRDSGCGKSEDVTDFHEFFAGLQSFNFSKNSCFLVWGLKRLPTILSITKYSSKFSPLSLQLSPLSDCKQ